MEKTGTIEKTRTIDDLQVEDYSLEPPTGRQNATLTQIEVVQIDNYDQEKNPGKSDALRFVFRCRNGAVAATFGAKISNHTRAKLAKFVLELSPRMPASLLERGALIQFVEFIKALRGKNYCITVVAKISAAGNVYYVVENGSPEDKSLGDQAEQAIENIFFNDENTF